VEADERCVEVVRDSFGMRNGSDAIGGRADDEHALSRNERRARERADDAVRVFESRVLQCRLVRRAEPPLIAREVGDRRERMIGTANASSRSTVARSDVV